MTSRFDELPHDLGIFSVAGGRALRHRLLQPADHILVARKRRGVERHHTLVLFRHAGLKTFALLVQRGRAGTEDR